MARIEALEMSSAFIRFYFEYFKVFSILTIQFYKLYI